MDGSNGNAGNGKAALLNKLKETTVGLDVEPAPKTGASFKARGSLI